jgi:hypothetical protein
LKGNILPVPGKVADLADRACRAVIAATLWHRRLVDDILIVAGASKQHANVPTHLYEIWHSVYVSQLRKWIRSEAQKATSESQLTAEGAYTDLCERILNTVGFLLKLNPNDSQAGITTNQVLDFVKLLIPYKDLEDEVRLRRLKARKR